MTDAGERHSGVAHFFSSMDPGGAELRTVEVVSQFPSTFDFVALSGRPGKLDDQLRTAGHRVVLLKMTVRNFSKMYRLMRSRKYRIAHSHLGLASGPVLLIAWAARVPKRIAHFRSDGVGGTPTVVRSVRLGISRFLVNRFATDIVGVSPGSLTYGWSDKWDQDPRCRVIPNGFDVARLRAEAEGAAQSSFPGDVVVNVGRADVVKNRGRTIDIWADFAQTYNSTLVLVGELNDDDSAKAAEANDGLTPTGTSAIVPIGSSREVARYLGSADALLSTSFREGLPGVVLESLAVGTPVVASDLPGTRWIASLLPGIELRSLESDNSEWTEALTRAFAADRQLIRNSFDASPFTLRNATEAFSLLWNEASAPTDVPRVKK